MKNRRLIKIHHTGFTVSDLDRSIAYFIDVLGFSLTSRAPRDIAIVEKVTGIPGANIETAYVTHGDYHVELIRYHNPPAKRIEALPCDAGHGHIAFDVENIEAFIEASLSHNVLPISDPVENTAGPNAGAKVVYLRDGDGITFEFIQR